MDACLEVVLHSNQALGHKHKLLRAKTACVTKWQCAGLAKGQRSCISETKGRKDLQFSYCGLEW